jgi:hypothetical protein
MMPMGYFGGGSLHGGGLDLHAERVTASATRTKMVLSGVAAVKDCSVKADRRGVDRLLVAEFRCDGPQRCRRRSGARFRDR